MKLTQISLFALACAAAPLAVQAGVEVGINLGGPEVIVRNHPPVDRYEPLGFAPGPGYFYVRGHWAWRRERWEWIGGRWELPAQPGATWVAGQWAPRGNGWVWIEGHYVTVYAPPPPPPAQQDYVEQEPPPPQFETVYAAPGPDFFWIGGHWRWDNRWVWAGGHYERHPHVHPGGGWEAGRWDRDHGHYVWREGHWR